MKKTSYLRKDPHGRNRHHEMSRETRSPRKAGKYGEDAKEIIPNGVQEPYQSREGMDVQACGRASRTRHILLVVDCTTPPAISLLCHTHHFPLPLGMIHPPTPGQPVASRKVCFETCALSADHAFILFQGQAAAHVHGADM